MDTTFSTLPAPVQCLRHERFSEEQGWRLTDLSLNPLGHIAVTGSNNITDRTCMDLYSDSRGKVKLFYTKEYDKDSSLEIYTYSTRLVAFLDNGNKIVTCVRNNLEVIQLKEDTVLRSRKVKDKVECLAAGNDKIYTASWRSKEVNIYNEELNEIRSVFMEGIQDGDYPYDMTVTAKGLFVCTFVWPTKALSFDKDSGKHLGEFKNETKNASNANSLTVSMELGLVAVLWDWNQILFYSLVDNTCLLIFECGSQARIRISDQGSFVTGSRSSGEVTMYNMAEMFNYNLFKQSLQSQLHTDDRLKLTNFFALPEDQRDAILKSNAPTENLLFALEEKGIIQESNVDRLAEAFTTLGIISSCNHLVNIYQKTRPKATLYDRFLVTLSAHLTASLPADLCDYFKISDEEKTSITSSQNAGLSLLLALDKTGVIKPSEVGALEQPFRELRLIQARAKIEEYQTQMREGNPWFQLMSNPSYEDKLEAFVQCLQNKIRSWYETMTPVPWKKSCRWSSKELFVGSGLILTDSKSKNDPQNIDPQCKLEYQDILTHDRLKAETRLVLEGEPGSGKTMLSSQLAYDWALGKFEDTKVLVFLPLKVVDGVKLVTAIRKFYCGETIPLTEEDIEGVLSRGDLSTAILLDGLEEYNSPVTETKPSEVHQVMSKAKYPGCKVVLTSRSDCVDDLPPCPMLKLGRFGEKERNSYIEKVFADNEEKQHEIKRFIEESPFILDLCSVPLLFVLVVHNVERMAELQGGEIDRITPFMCGMVQTLCPSYYHKDGSHNVELEDNKPRVCSIDELAFKGLCKRYQQLSWSKEFMEKHVDHLKDWTDSGFLVVEEELVGRLKEEVVVRRQLKEEPRDSLKVTEEGNMPSTSGLSQGKDSENMEYDKGPMERLSGSADFSEKESEQTSSGSLAKLVPLRIKFLHKVFQEWCAAKYLSSVIWSQGRSSFREKLASINPADLHYVLRFTCYLCPSSCHVVLNHLLNRRRNDEGIVPKHIMDCMCLCYAEYNGLMGDDMKKVVTEICKEPVEIGGTHSRLLQHSKVAMLKFASQSGIPILKAQLVDVIDSVDNNLLILNSGVTLGVLHTLRKLEVSQWDQTLGNKDYISLVNFIVASNLISHAYLSFPSQPPSLPPNTMEEVASKHITFKWRIGPTVHTLDPSKKLWTDPRVEICKGPLHLGTSGSLTSTKQKVFNPQETELSYFASEVPVLKHPTKTYSCKEEGSSVKSFPRMESRGCREATVLSVECTVSNGGGFLQIKDTEVTLTIPPDALGKSEDHCLIQMRIIPPGRYHQVSTSFCSNSSVVVELLPNNLRFKQSLKLTLPHCLKLKKGMEPKARILMSHHEGDVEPRWKEVTNDYILDDRMCTIWLKRFSWIKYEIDDETVEAKRITLFTAAEQIDVPDDIVDIMVGYHPDLPGAEKILQSNPKLIVGQRLPFLLLKQGKLPLKVFLEGILPCTWHYSTPEENPQEISFRKMVSPTENLCQFTLKHDTKTSDTPHCRFRAWQNFNHDGIVIIIRPKASTKVHCEAEGHHQDSDIPQFPSQLRTRSIGIHSQSEDHSVNSEELELQNCFMILKKKLIKEWKDCGRYLGMEEEDLECLGKEHSDCKEECIYQMLLKWQRKNYPNATSVKLIKALEQLGRRDLVEELKEKCRPVVRNFDTEGH